MLFNELDLLEGRLEYLYDTVDYFVIVECNITHAGKPKPLNYLKNISRYKKYSDKIFYFPFNPNTSELNFEIDRTNLQYDSPFWQIEKRQRDYIGEALKFFNADDIVLLGDLDEIPIKSAIDSGKEKIETGAAASICLNQELYFYNFLQKQSFPSWGTIITTNKFLQEVSAQWLRDMRSQIPQIFQGGYHLSYWGDADQVSTKIQNFAHQEFNEEQFTDIDLVKRRIEYGQDPFNRQSLIRADTSLILPEIYEIFKKYT
jgi:beta-1,4-mannosyl-glycoprotein beta-1,4-N-acetylglucosaminyltransferase